MEFAELVKRFAAAAASGNGDALADLFTPGGTYDDYFFGPCTGRDAIKTMLAHFGDGGRNFRWEFLDPALSGNIGYASYRFSFESKRPEAKGARVTFDGIGQLGEPVQFTQPAVQVDCGRWTNEGDAVFGDAPRRRDIDVAA